MPSFIFTSFPSHPQDLVTKSCPNSPLNHLENSVPEGISEEESKMTDTNKPSSHLAGKYAFPSYDLGDPRLGQIDRYTLEHLHPESHPVGHASLRS